MKLFRRPGFRLLVEAAAIVLTAVATGFGHVSASGIAASVAVVWVIAALIEYSLSHPRPSPARQAAPEPSEAEPVRETVRVLPPTAHVAAPEPGHLKPTGEWNAMEIRAEGAHLPA